MQLQAPAVLGQTALFALQHPTSAAGNLYLLLWSTPFAGAVSVSLPGFTVNGLARVDSANLTLATVGLLDSTGLTPNYAVPVPNHPPLVGYAWDLQFVDLDAASTCTFSDDDLAMTLAAPPLPSANMIPIAPGTFQMGSAAVFGGLAVPVHQVTISRPFWMGRNEVTQAEYQTVMGTNPSFFPGPSRPVEQVSWNDAVAYCDAMTAAEAAAGRLPTGYEYRLPTEAEWEYCCRAGTTTEWSFGNVPSCSLAHYAFCAPAGQTIVVGSLPANPWGLHDMHGNVWEFCLDGFNGTTYQPGPATNPYVPSSSLFARARRGGSWSNGLGDAMSAARGGDVPTTSYRSIGFRVVCAPILP